MNHDLIEAINQLNEMPQNIGDLGNMFNVITRLYSLAKNMGIKETKVAHNIYKIQDDNGILYYYKENNIIIIGVYCYADMNSKSILKISLTAKNPNFTGKPPYAITVYNAIINDLPQNGYLLSDTILSADSIKIWKRLAKEHMGRVEIYDKTNNTFDPINNPQELNRAFNMSNDMKKYQFAVRGKNTKTTPETQRIQQLAGIKKEIK